VENLLPTAVLMLVYYLVNMPVGDTLYSVMFGKKLEIRVYCCWARDAVKIQLDVVDVIATSRLQFRPFKCTEIA
jgi:hypothetical protein